MVVIIYNNQSMNLERTIHRCDTPQYRICQYRIKVPLKNNYDLQRHLVWSKKITSDP